VCETADELIGKARKEIKDSAMEEIKKGAGRTSRLCQWRTCKLLSAFEKEETEGERRGRYEVR
jgi:hypothetical protein